MNDQLEFWNQTVPEPANQRLFLAILPDDSSAQIIHSLAVEMRQKHGLVSKVLPLNHLHITLRWIDDYVEIPRRTLEDVGRACEATTAWTAPFEITFDQVVGWGRGLGRHPLVLTGHGDRNDVLLEFQHGLWKELIKCGHPGKGGRDFNPHVTLLYDEQSLPEEPVRPVSWMVRDIVLVHSELGRGKYHELGRWKLRG